MHFLTSDIREKHLCKIHIPVRGYAQRLEHSAAKNDCAFSAAVFLENYAFTSRVGALIPLRSFSLRALRRRQAPQ